MKLIASTDFEIGDVVVFELEPCGLELVIAIDEKGYTSLIASEERISKFIEGADPVYRLVCRGKK